YRICMEKIGRPDMVEKEEYKTGTGRTAHREEINKVFADWALEHTIDECLSILGDDIPNNRIYNAADIVKDPQFAFRNDIIEVESPKFGKFKMQNVVPKMSGTPGEVRWLGADLGAFNNEVLHDMLGYSNEEIEQFKANGTI
ncbi:MAG: CoA transferase, partial [Pyramidobacter sp.]|nr:CoA transferase [Pyramidobacter sp.]